MHDYRLFIYNENGQVTGAAQVISAANDDEAIAQAEAIRGSLAAEVLDFDGLRIVRRLPPKEKARLKPPNRPPQLAARVHLGRAISLD
jgi:hypothetical protein